MIKATEIISVAFIFYNRSIYLQDFVVAIVANVSPSWEKISLNKFNSSGDLSFEIAQAIDVIKLTISQEFKTNTSNYYMKKRFS